MLNGIHRINRSNINTKEYWDDRFVSKNTNNGTSACFDIVDYLLGKIEDNDSVKNCLDIGSGPMKDESFMVHIGNKFPKFKRYVVDISSEICVSWRGSGVIAKNNELVALDFEDNFFDIILCSHVLEHVTDIFSALDEIKRISKNGSIVIINSPIGEAWSHEKEHVWWMGEDVDYGIGEIVTSFTGNQFKSLIQIYKVVKG